MNIKTDEYLMVQAGPTELIIYDFEQKLKKKTNHGTATVDLLPLLSLTVRISSLPSPSLSNIHRKKSRRGNLPLNFI